MEEEIVLMEENDIEEINIEEENYSGKPYVLPIASADTLGGIKVGNNLTIDEDGTLNATGGGSGTSGDLSNLKYNYVVDGERLYVDRVNGNDETGDGTESKPFKTLERFFDVANYIDGGRNDIRCYIVSAGVYTITKQSINHLTIHITGLVEGVILKFTTDRDMKFYECHTNLNNLTIQYPNATEFAFDGGSFSILNCTFEGEIRTYSCGGKMESVTMNNIQCHETNISLWKTNITNTKPSLSPYYFNTSTARIYGTTTFAELSSSGIGNDGLIASNNSRVTIQFTPANKTNKYNYGIYANGSIFIMSSARLEAFKNRFISGIGYGDTKNLYMTDTLTLM